MTFLCVFSLCGTTTYAQEDAVPVISGDVKVASRFYDLLFGEEETANETTEKTKLLIPGGDVFGVRIGSGEVVVADNAEALAQDPSFPLMTGDRILSIDGSEVHSSKDVREKMQNAQNPLPVTVSRGGKTYTFDVPLFGEEGNYRIGIALRDGAAGIGTVTFIDTDTGLFGGLGHAISDPDTGDPIPLCSGDVTEVILGGVKKGEVGQPGELHGVLKSESVGTLYKNDERGVFGTIRTAVSGEAIPVGKREELKEGEATILSTVKNGEKAAYTVSISDIHPDEKGSKCFTVTVTDKTLFSLTGGIVRGMSGSPIIQDGKIVGAVTHVLISDPKVGYGIFIENMLDAADEVKSETKQAA